MKPYLLPFLVIFFLSYALEASRAELELLERSRQLTSSYHYVAALEVLQQGIRDYPDNQAIVAEFERNSKLYIMHEISVGYGQVSANPHDVNAYLRIARAFILAQNTLKALEVLLEGVGDNPKSPSLWREIARVETLAGRPLEAASAMKEAKRYESLH